MSLSDKSVGDLGYSYFTRDVKEFIKKLKAEFCNDHCVDREVNAQIINELAGEKLI